MATLARVAGTVTRNPRLRVWLLVVVIGEAVRIGVVLNGPPSPDLYANHLNFQLIASAFVILTMWLPILVGVLLFQAAIFQVRDRFKIGRMQ